ncbi:MAG TPA: DUF480 domain-containing protein [Acidimicrobiales bacterium]
MELTAAEGRVLGCLIERAALAPEAYPVSLNTLRLACNQTTNRNPIVAYDDRTVEDTLLALKSKGLARFVDTLRGDRAIRYSHRADHRWRLGPADLAVLSVLLVGGPLPLSEIEARARRLYPFTDTDEVLAVLDGLAARTPSPFAARLDPRPGPEARWVEVLTGDPPASVVDGRADEAADGAGTGGGRGRGEARDAGSAVVVPPRLVPAPSYAELAARVAELERRLAAATERPGARGGAEWPGRTVPLGDAPDDRYGGPRWGEAVPQERALPASGVPLVSLADLVDRLTDIERRLARIEAELGALR